MKLEPDFKAIDLASTHIILVRRGSRLTAETVAAAKLPPTVKHNIAILVVDQLDDIRAIPDKLMHEAGWVRRET